jgi:hypothetical protein
MGRLLAEGLEVKRSTYLLTGLIRIHAELAREISLVEKEAERIRDDMKHVEHVLHLVQPDFNARQIAILRRREPQSTGLPRGHFFRRTIEILRTAPGPLTVAEIADEFVRVHGVPSQTHRERDKLRNTIAHRFSTIESGAGLLLVIAAIRNDGR